MINIALKILIGDRAKYIGLVFGITFATLLIAQQVSIFIGIMSRTAGSIYAVSEADIWVMDTRVRYIDEVEPMRDIELTNIRSVGGVEWAVPFYKGLTTIRMPNGLTQQVQLIGVDDVSLIGICPTMVKGEMNSILYPQSALIDSNGFKFTWPNEPLALGKYIELNDNRLIINGICEASPTFLTFPILYITYNKAMEVTPPQRNKMSFVLVKAKEGYNLQDLKQSIEHNTDLKALTQNEFAWKSINYYLERTGIPINFGITIMLGVIIGGAITAQTFYIFVVENLKQFAAMKAIGVTNFQLFKIVFTQASLVYVLGYSLGIGLTALFFFITKDAPALKGFVLHWQVMFGTGALIAVIIIGSIIFSLRKVFSLDPAIVFRG
ncbi:MAG: FtsX-like permease family protein [Alphaproteobacteria bacterium]|jgi:putative ABC transport system permease protein|nr:ABC transporter permease [Candidatus Jidaibacter sp.]